MTYVLSQPGKSTTLSSPLPPDMAAFSTPTYELTAHCSTPGIPYPFVDLIQQGYETFDRIPLRIFCLFLDPKPSKNGYSAKN